MTIEILHRTDRVEPLVRKAADLKLGGTYEIIHGKIFLSKDNYAIVGDIVELSDVDAALICEQKDAAGRFTMVRRVTKAEVAARNAAADERARKKTAAVKKTQARAA